MRGPNGPGSVQNPEAVRGDHEFRVGTPQHLRSARAAQFQDEVPPAFVGHPPLPRQLALDALQPSRPPHFAVRAVLVDHCLPQLPGYRNKIAPHSRVNALQIQEDGCSPAGRRGG